MPHEIIIYNDKDYLWIKKHFETLIVDKSALCKRLKRRILNSKLLDKLDAWQAKLQSSINCFRFEYYRKISKKNNYLIHPLALNAIGLY